MTSRPVGTLALTYLLLDAGDDLDGGAARAHQEVCALIERCKALEAERRLDGQPVADVLNASRESLVAARTEAAEYKAAIGRLQATCLGFKAERDALRAALGRARVALTFYSTQMPEGKTYPYGLDAEERAAKLVPDAWGAMLAVGQKPDGESQEVKS